MDYEKEYKKALEWAKKVMQGKGGFVLDDEVEPKFKEGDWVMDINGIVKQILSYNDGVYKHTNGYSAKIFEDEWRLWDITKDAKDGDVLEFGDHGRLVVGIVSYVNKTTGKVDVNCLLENNKFKVGNYYNLDTIKPHPATKEQRDQLEKAMADAGYTFDFEKKELKKMEQKPAEWSEDEKNIDFLIHLIEYNVPNHSFAFGDGCAYGYKSKEEAINMLKSLKDRYTWKPSKEMLEALYKAIPQDVMEKSEDEILLDKLYQGLKYGKVLSDK